MLISLEPLNRGSVTINSISANARTSFHVISDFVPGSACRAEIGPVVQVGVYSLCLAMELQQRFSTETLSGHDLQR